MRRHTQISVPIEAREKLRIIKRVLVKRGEHPKGLMGRIVNDLIQAKYHDLVKSKYIKPEDVKVPKPIYSNDAPDWWIDECIAKLNQK